MQDKKSVGTSDAQSLCGVAYIFAFAQESDHGVFSFSHNSRFIRFPHFHDGKEPRISVDFTKNAKENVPISPGFQRRFQHFWENR
ncbi:MAG: hypothetical protein LUC50_05400 [Ruminococcus sp.]|nr:hypothetical protein [Ruminococcus sp.]